MTLQPSAFRVRLVVGGVAFVALAALYLRAVASAHAFHSVQAFTHPWHDVVADVLLFALSAVSGFAALPVLRRGGLAQRVCAAFCLALPAWVLGDFIFWLSKGL
jgi:hypothetical protein